MASLQASADSIRANISSTSTCTPATLTLLAELLLPKVNTAKSALSSKTTKTTKATAAPKTRVKPKISSSGTEAVVKQAGTEDHKDQLSPKERFILATEVINAALKSLTDAIKAPNQAPTKRQPCSKDAIKVSSRKTLRRSNSMPQSPLQPRSLNRVASSPSISLRHSRSNSSISLSTSGHKSTGECARAAFSCLRTLQASKTPGIDLPPFQIENGMSVLIGKLIILGLDDLAIKELRILKKRLQAEDVPKKGSAPKAAAPTTPQSLPELLDFGTASFTGVRLGLVVATQLHVVRLLSSCRKSSQIEVAVRFLAPENPSAPLALLIQSQQEAGDKKQSDKVARQFQTLSESLLSLCPSITSSDDSLALEPRLSISPGVAIQFQVLALRTRLMWWSVVGHKGDTSKDILEPLLRCLSTFARRSQFSAPETYHIASAALFEIQDVISESKAPSLTGSHTTLSGLYRLLGSLSKDAGAISEAISWTEKVRALFDPKKDSDARKSSIIARLASLYLRKSSRTPKEEEILLELLEALERPFKGEASEIDELITEISFTRRAANSILTKTRPSSTADGIISGGLREMCETFIFLCPRLSLRYLGNPLDESWTTKDIIRHNQRQQLITMSALHCIDSALFLVKIMSNEGRLTWELLDSRLQDCLLLHDRLDVEARGVTMDDGSPPPAYTVRISNLYFAHFLNKRRGSDSLKDGQQYRILRRAIDCMQGRPAQERKAAFLSTKLERMAEFCKQTNRYDELIRVLSTLRDELIEQGVLFKVVELANSQPMSLAWVQSEESAALGRTLQSLVKVQLKQLKSSASLELVDTSWSHEERAAVLEYQIELLTASTSSSVSLNTTMSNAFQTLLGIYEIDKYPIRRLRVLLQLSTICTVRPEDIFEDVDVELAAFANGEVGVEKSSDVALQSYLQNYRLVAMTSTQLRAEEPDIDVFKHALSEWTSMRERCVDLAQLERQVEDIDGLLNHLQAISDFMQVKGHDKLRLITLRLAIEFNQLLDPASNADACVSGFTSLGAQWLSLGYSGRAGLAFDKAKLYNHHNGVSLNTAIQLHLSYSEYLLTIGNYEKSEEQLTCAQTLYTQSQNGKANKMSFTLEQRTRKNLLISNAYLVHSRLALERGAAHIALNDAKQSLRLLRRAWTNTQEQFRSRSSTPDASSVITTEKLSEEFSQLSVRNISLPVDHRTSVSGSSFWPLIPPLFHGLNFVSRLYAHHGMFQETLYYAQEAHKLASEVGSEIHVAMASALLGSIWLRSGTLDKGSEFLMMAKKCQLSGDGSLDSATLAFYTGSMQGRLGDREAELAAYNEADLILRGLSSPEYIKNADRLLLPTEPVEECIAKLTISKRSAPVSRRAPIRAKAVGKSKTAMRPKTPIEVIQPVVEECPQLASLKMTVLREKARALMFLKRTGEALTVLQEAERHAMSPLQIIDQGLAMANQLLLQGLEQMTGDPIYSVLQESTISFPSVVGLNRSEKVGERLSAVKASPPRKGSKSQDHMRSRSPVPVNFFDKLRQAQEVLTEVYATSVAVAPLAVIHNVSSLLNSVAILLSALSQGRAKSVAHPGFATCSVETARTIALRRQRKVLLAEASNSLDVDSNCWPSPVSSESRRSSIGFSNDMSRFQQNYIDIIPKHWVAISISLSDSRNELSITKLQAGYSPFILRLPLGRHNSMDADEEVFGFEQGQAELLEIIQLANESAHDARDMSSKDAKAAWWEERESLDARLRDLLENIEKVWLGGFTGIFSQHARRPDILSRFQKSVQNILDKHLPSRRKTGKRGMGQRVTLDSRILELFIGLGDASDEECDFSEPLTDLLYFIVDILQFHGEHNAYAEIDFDSIMVEMHDALRGYHTAVNAAGDADEGRHTVLILDKALHAFPWESLPCMEGLAVSRLPSLGCLRDRILKAKDEMPDGTPEGHYIDRSNGSYILNPSGDLKNTQTTFQKSLQGFSDWDGITKRIPTEEEIKTNLGSKDLYLYFGHGSGAQYIRAREIRKLEKCAVTWLMGCSSGALEEVGEFEPYGPPINYMHAGCPALVATLWDVTDKDIDRFAKTTFEHWGLFEKEGSKKAKGKRRADVIEEEQRMSLVEAVAKGREACNLRYLNAAAVCVYGVPVYIR